MARDAEAILTDLVVAWESGRSLGHIADLMKEATVCVKAQATDVASSGVWTPCTPELIKSGVDCASAPRRSGVSHGHEHLVDRRFLEGAWTPIANAEPDILAPVEITWLDGTTSPAERTPYTNVAAYWRTPDGHLHGKHHVIYWRQRRISSADFIPPGHLHPCRCCGGEVTHRCNVCGKDVANPKDCMCGCGPDYREEDRVVLRFHARVDARVPAALWCGEPSEGRLWTDDPDLVTCPECKPWHPIAEKEPPLAGWMNVLTDGGAEEATRINTPTGLDRYWRDRRGVPHPKLWARAWRLK